MKAWVVISVAGLLAAVYALFYLITATESEGASSLGLANSVGLLSVVIGLFAAFLIFRRATPVR